MKYSIRKALVFAIFLLAPYLSFCQDTNDLDFGFGDPDAVQAEVPIDDGLVWLLVAGIGYGLYIGIANRRRKPVSTS